MQEELKDDPSYVDVINSFRLEKPGGEWTVHIGPLAVVDTLSVTLMQPGSTRTNFLLDWHGIFSNPKLGRLHMYPGEDPQSPYEIKLERMQKWVNAIEIYDDLMVDQIHDKLTKDAVREIIRSNRIPRPETVVLATGREGLKKLFATLGFGPGYGVSLVGDWKKIAELAKSGKFLETWKRQKDHPSQS